MPIFIYILIMMAALSPKVLWAHAPQFHDFRLVSFSRPFPAPGFELPDLTDKARQLTDFKGQYVLLNFWATWCALRGGMPAWTKLHQQLQPQGCTVLAVSGYGGTAKLSVYPQTQVTFPSCEMPIKRFPKSTVPAICRPHFCSTLMAT